MQKNEDIARCCRLGEIYNVTANLAGLPAISVPCGKNSNGLPVGIQFAASTMNAIIVLTAAEVHKAATG